MKRVAGDTAGLMTRVGRQGMRMQGNQAKARWPVDLSRMAPEAAAEWVIERYWDDAMPILPERVARSMGVKTAYLRGGETSSIGIDRDGTPVILVDREDSYHRQRFAAAHGLGHILLRHDAPSPEGPRSFGHNPLDPRDRAANLFAAHLLVPTRQLRWCMSSGWMRNFDQVVDTLWVHEGLVLYRYEQLLADD